MKTPRCSAPRGAARAACAVGVLAAQPFMLLDSPSNQEQYFSEHMIQPEPCEPRLSPRCTMDLHQAASPQGFRDRLAALESMNIEELTSEPRFAAAFKKGLNEVSHLANTAQWSKLDEYYVQAVLRLTQLKHPKPPKGLATPDELLDFTKCLETLQNNSSKVTELGYRGLREAQKHRIQILEALGSLEGAAVATVNQLAAVLPAVRELYLANPRSYLRTALKTLLAQTEQLEVGPATALSKHERVAFLKARLEALELPPVGQDAVAVADNQAAVAVDYENSRLIALIVANDMLNAKNALVAEHFYKTQQEQLKLFNDPARLAALLEQAAPLRGGANGEELVERLNRFQRLTRQLETLIAYATEFRVLQAELEKYMEVLKQTVVMHLDRIATFIKLFHMIEDPLSPKINEVYKLLQKASA